MRSPLDGKVLSQGVDAGLCRRNVKLHRRAEVMQRGADIQDLTLVLFQLFERSAANIERALQIDIDHRAKTVGGKFLSRAEKVSGGAVDDDVHFSESFDGGRDSL